MEDGLFELDPERGGVTRPRGGLAVIARPVSLAPILAALAGRFGSAEILPVHARADTPAIRIVVRAKERRAALLTLRPPLILHDGPGDGFRRARMR